MELKDLKIKDSYKVFFALDGKGITSTSANHACNKAKELLKTKQSMVSNINFVNEDAQLIGTDIKNPISYGAKQNDLLVYRDYVKDIANANAMIAWLKEAIKAKNEVINYYKYLSFEDYKKIVGTPEIVCPNIIVYVEDDAVADWDADKRNKYFALEAFCSLVGKFIHPKGSFYEAKKNFDNALTHPNKVEGTGRDAIVYSYSPSIDSDTVKHEYSWYADELRHKEAEFNKMKQEIDDYVNQHNINAQKEYNIAYKEYVNKMSELNKEYELYKKEGQLAAAKLKIYLPTGIKSTYDKVSKSA